MCGAMHCPSLDLPNTNFALHNREGFLTDDYLEFKCSKGHIFKEFKKKSINMTCIDDGKVAKWVNPKGNADQTLPHCERGNFKNGCRKQSRKFI